MTAGVYRVTVDSAHGSSGGNVTLTTVADLTAYLTEVVPATGDLPDQIVVARLYDVADVPEDPPLSTGIGRGFTRTEPAEPGVDTSDPNDHGLLT